MYFSKFTVLLALASIGVVNSQSNCNGYPELCSRPYNSLTYLTTHNSYAYVASPAANQLCPPVTQLDDGVRSLKLSAILPNNATMGNSSDSIYLCHTSCSILNAGPAVDTLTNITQWVKNNPNEVVTIMWDNLGAFSPAAFEAAYNASGLAQYSYVQSAQNFTWPTLGEIISSGKTVITFIDEGADPTQVPYLNREWDFVFETPYDNSNSSSFSCVIDRPTIPPSPSQMMYVMNHFLYGVLTLGSTEIEIPQRGTANVTNAVGSLSEQATQCTSTFGRQPNFLEIDFFNLGDALKIAAQLNNVTYTAPSELQCDVYATNAANTVKKGSSSGASKDVVGSTTALFLSFVATIFFTMF